MQREHRPPDRKTSNFRHISTQFNDPEDQVPLVLRAKYSYFTRVKWFGSLLVVWTLFLPFAYASAFSISSLWSSKGDRDLVSNIKVESQNSQRMNFLEAAVNIDPNPAKGDGGITIVDDSALFSESGPSGTISDIVASSHQGKVSLYIVRTGDTLSQIAKMFDVSVNTILWANDLRRRDILRPGKTLVILPVDGIQHTVQKGETLPGIAKKYKGDVDEIVTFNDLVKGEDPEVGTEIVVPGGIEVSIEKPADIQKSNIKSTRSRMIAKYPSYQGYYIHPFPTMIHKSQNIHGFNGVDLAGRTGEPILAAADGVVVVSRASGWNGGYGKYIILEHANGTQTVYGHMNALYVEEGMRIRSGRQIGENGNTGNSTGPHLHFEVRGAKNPF